MNTEVEEKDKNLLLSQWQTCVEMANAISQRRDTMNNLFVTLNIALIATISFVWNIQTVCISIIGVAFCVVWICLINNYKQLNKEKFFIINEIEKDLPYQPFNDEWSNLKSNKKYQNSTTIEYVMPAIFIIAYITISIILFIKK